MTKGFQSRNIQRIVRRKKIHQFARSHRYTIVPTFAFLQVYSASASEYLGVGSKQHCSTSVNQQSSAFQLAHSFQRERKAFTSSNEILSGRADYQQVAQPFHWKNLSAVSKPAPSSLALFSTTSSSDHNMAESTMTDTKDTVEETPKIPSPPFAYLPSDSKLLDLSSLETVLAETSGQRQEAYDLGNQIKAALLKCRASLEQHQTPERKKELQDQLDALVKQALDFHRDQKEGDGDDNDKKISVRMGNLNNHFADYLRHQAYEHFIETGTLLSPPSQPNEELTPGSSSTASSDFSDEEYLGGILSFVNFDLKRYVIGRGTHRDAHSVLLARDMVAALLDHLLQYDFRNGPLRRKYDGVKYTLKTCETVLYELSVTGCQQAMEAQAAAANKSKSKRSNQKGNNEPPSKRSKSGASGGKRNSKSESEPVTLTPSPFMNVHALDALRLRIMEKDELREKLIKKCRDGQKAAKQAIYALHRDDFDGASQLLDQCEQCILEELEPIVKFEPHLRHGSYANVLEEYAEAKLYQVWLVGKNENAMQEDKHGNSPAKVVLLPEDFSKIKLEPQEYLGGLCDLTGEIGRYAVKKATIRDKENVKNCLETNMSVLYAMESLGKVPGNIGKKIDPLRRTVEKQERMLYELSLVEATGRNTIVAGVEATVEE